MTVHNAFGCPGGSRGVADHEWIVERDSCECEFVVWVGSLQEVMSCRVSERLAHNRDYESRWHWLEPRQDLIKFIKSRNSLAFVHSIAINEQDARSHLLQSRDTSFQPQVRTDAREDRSNSSSSMEQDHGEV